jgi:ABC-2 type transport system permease protein
LGAFTIYGLCCAIFFVYGVVISFFAQPQWSVVLCPLLGMLLLGMAIIAMNIFISSLTESMVVAAVIGMAAGLVIDTMSSFSELVPIPWVQFVLEKIDFLNYYTNFTYGILSIVDVIFFLSVTGLFLFFTVRVLERRRWS